MVTDIKFVINNIPFEIVTDWNDRVAINQMTPNRGRVYRSWKGNLVEGQFLEDGYVPPDLARIVRNFISPECKNR